MSGLLNGPQTLGNGRAFWIGALVVFVAALIYPLFSDPYDVGNVAYFFAWIFMALGLCVMWGYCGLLSFGQTFFFGLGGYGMVSSRSTSARRTAAPWPGSRAASRSPLIAAAILGYFMIYGRISGVFFGIVTLSCTLALAFFVGRRPAPEWTIGAARLNGFNGMQGMAPLSLPWFGGDIDLEETALYYFLAVLLTDRVSASAYPGDSRFGNVLVAIREDPHAPNCSATTCASTRLATFVLGSALGDSVGAVLLLGQFIAPSSIGLPAAAAPVVWVAFSGRSDLTATLVGTFVLLFVFQSVDNL